MKKLIGIVFVLVIMFALSINVFAGDTPEVILTEDDEILFIGIVEDYKKNFNNEPLYAEYDSIKVKVAERIKGNAVVGESIECQGTLAFDQKLKKGDYYLCTCNNKRNSLFLWVIEEKTDNQIKVFNSEASGIPERIEKYINDGSYAKAEAERVSKLTEEEKAALGENSIVKIEKKPDVNYSYLIPIAAVVISVVAVIIALKKKNLK